MADGSRHQVRRIRMAYDLTVEQYHRGIDPLEAVPEDLKNSPGFEAFMAEAGPLSTGGGAPEIRAFLEPRKGMRFLDAGCGAGLAVHRLREWPSVYFGADVSPALISEMAGFARQRRLRIGGLCLAEIAGLPFRDETFDIAMSIGVLEYYPLDYCRRALQEMHRVLKPSARLVVDVANVRHPHADLMFRLEVFLGRPHCPKSRRDFEALLAPLFSVEGVDDSKVMLKYFLRRKAAAERGPGAPRSCDIMGGPAGGRAEKGGRP